MKLEQLNEAIKQFIIDDAIASLRSNHYFFVQNGLRGASEFTNGKCFEFAIALYNYLKSKGEQPQLIYLMGNMKKSEARWYDTTEFDPTQEHPFHTIVQVRKFYYDINGKLGNKRDIATGWPKFRNKQLVPTTYEDVMQYVKDKKIIEDIETVLKEFK